MNNLTPLVTSIEIATTKVHRSPGQMGYGRVDNATRLALEGELAELEGARFALAFASGSAALAAVFSLLSKGDGVVSHREQYEGTERMLDGVFSRFGITNQSIDFTDAKDLQKMKSPRLMICESITNPTLQVIPLKRVAGTAKAKEALLAVDNTVATPVFLRPLEAGADIVIHSLTKFIGGHHDAMAGAVMTNNRDLFESLRSIQWNLGAVPGPFDCSLIMRGIRTLPLRMQGHRSNARAVARFLRSHKRIGRVSFPGISGMVSFWMKGDPGKFMRALEHVRIAHSFGGTETTVLHPRSMMTWTRSEQELERDGITGRLFRLSVGLEVPEVVIGDLAQALERCV